jgi:hypothetical protein
MIFGELPPNMMCLGRFLGDFGKSLFLQSNNSSKMAKKKKKQRLTQEQRIAQEYTDGFVVKRYSRLVQAVVLLASLILSLIPPILLSSKWELHVVVIVLLFVAFMLLGFPLAKKIIIATGTKVNLKITKVGLEQTKLSRSVLVPKKRIVEWENMKFYRFCWDILIIRTKKGRNYLFTSIIPMYWPTDDSEVLDDFLWEFERLAKQHKIQRKHIL